MKGKHHLCTGLVASFIIYIVSRILFFYGIEGPVDLFSAFFFGSLGSMFPDLDIPIVGKSKHRNWMFHSMIIPVVVLVYSIVSEPTRLYDLVYLSMTLGLHLIGDLKPNKSNNDGNSGKIGTYLIWVRKGKRLKAPDTDKFLAWCGISCIAISILSWILLVFGAGNWAPIISM